MCPDFRGGAKKQPVPWPGGPGYNGAFVNMLSHSVSDKVLENQKWTTLMDKQ